MSVPTNPPVVSKITTVANISTTSRFPVERSSAAKPPPQTRPTPTPTAPIVIPREMHEIAGISKAPSPLRESLEAFRKTPQPGASVPARRVAPSVNTGPGYRDPEEGIGAGSPPPGGMKIR